MSNISRYRIKTKSISYGNPKIQITRSSCQRVQEGARTIFSRAIIESPVRKPERDKSWERWKKEFARARRRTPVHVHPLMGIVNFYIKRYNSLFSMSGAFNRVTHACMTGSVSARSVPLRASVSPVKGRKRRGLVSGASPL